MGIEQLLWFHRSGQKKELKKLSKGEGTEQKRTEQKRKRNGNRNSSNSSSSRSSIVNPLLLPPPPSPPPPPTPHLTPSHEKPSIPLFTFER
ncbi:hypothetical protein M0804_009152 [Polistes exclamans]|nr:hypothetical protein M0804_009152 [Polistes exclamans]